MITTRRSIFLHFLLFVRKDTLRHNALPAEQVGPFDRLSIKGLTAFAPGSSLSLEGKRPDGSTYSIPVNHTFNDNQINWCVTPFCGGAQGYRNEICIMSQVQARIGTQCHGGGGGPQVTVVDVFG